MCCFYKYKYILSYIAAGLCGLGSSLTVDSVMLFTDLLVPRRPKVVIYIASPPSAQCFVVIYVF